jgi:hypothetical protein
MIHSWMPYVQMGLMWQVPRRFVKVICVDLVPFAFSQHRESQ